LLGRKCLHIEKHAVFQYAWVVVWIMVGDGYGNAKANRDRVWLRQVGPMAGFGAGPPPALLVAVGVILGFAAGMGEATVHDVNPYYVNTTNQSNNSQF